MLISLLQQIVSAALVLLFGVLALRICVRTRAGLRDRPAVAWRLATAHFLVVGSIATAQALLSAGAVMAGRDSALFHWVGTYGPAANLGRGVASIVFGLMLIAAAGAYERWLPRLVSTAPSALVATTVVVTFLTLEVPVSSVNFVLAILSTVTAVVIMGALFIAVLNDSMDQLLWLALSAYALKETLRVSLFAVIAWWMVGQDVTAYRMFYWVGIFFSVTMVVLAVRRLRAAAAGRTVPALFERLSPMRTNAAGSRIA